MGFYGYLLICFAPMSCFWDSEIFGIAFAATYLFSLMSFLNALYEQGILFSWQKRTRDVKLFFSSDIFDVFWIVLAAIPNAIFAQTYFLETYLALPESYGDVFVYGVIGGFFVVMIGVSCATKRFISHGQSWIAEVDKKGKKGDEAVVDKYTVLELISAFIFSVEAICVLVCIFCSAVGFITLSESLAVRTFVTSIILFLYWLMLILSKIINRMIMGDPQSNRALFSVFYRFLGSIAVVVVMVSTYLLASVAKSGGEQVLESYRFIIGSVLIPCVPIAIQLMQIIKPKS